jgi:hypothetical protein
MSGDRASKSIRLYAFLRATKNAYSGGIIHAAIPAPASTPTMKTVVPATMRAGLMVSNLALRRPAEPAQGMLSNAAVPVMAASVNNRNNANFIGYAPYQTHIR